MTNLPNAWRVYVNGQTEAGYDAYANFQQVTNGAYGVDTPEHLTVGFDFYPAETDITRLTFVPIRNMGEKWMLAIRMRKRGLRWNFRNDAHICIENTTYEWNSMFFSPDHLRFSANHAIMKAI